MCNKKSLIAPKHFQLRKNDRSNRATNKKPNKLFFLLLITQETRDGMLLLLLLLLNLLLLVMLVLLLLLLLTLIWWWSSCNRISELAEALSKNDPIRISLTGGHLQQETVSVLGFQGNVGSYCNTFEDTKSQSLRDRRKQWLDLQTLKMRRM